MPLRVDFDLYGDKQFSREVRRTGAHAENMRPVMDQVAWMFLGSIRENIDTAGSSGGSPWEPLKQSTIDHKTAIGAPDPTRILFRFGDLFESFKYGDEFNIFETGDDFLVVGSAIPYGVYHQSSAPRTLLPRRPLLNLREDERADAIRAIQSWVITGRLKVF